MKIVHAVADTEDDESDDWLTLCGRSADELEDGAGVASPDWVDHHVRRSGGTKRWCPDCLNLIPDDELKLCTCPELTEDEADGVRWMDAQERKVDWLLEQVTARFDEAGINIVAAVSLDREDNTISLHVTFDLDELDL